MNTTDLTALLESWTLALRAERKSPHTIKAYRAGVVLFLNWCHRTDTPAVLARAAVKGFIADLLGGGQEASTAHLRLKALKRFSAWLAEEGEQDRDDLLGLKSPKVDAKVVPELTPDEVRALVKACRGPAFRDRRDEAMVRLMVEVGARAGEVVGMAVEDLNITTGLATIRRGKGGKGRMVPLGAQTCRALDRYLRARRGHPAAALGDLWLSERGAAGLTYRGLRYALDCRARAAGLKGFHPHVLRHTAAGRWLAAGGSEGGLMAVAGWSRRDMLDRYTRSTSERRAAEEARRLNLGDVD